MSAVSKAMPPIAILAGGLATRLRPLTTSIPKSMVEVAGAPFIQHQLQLLAREGFRDIVICTGHLGDQIESFVGTGARFGCSVQYSKDGVRPLGTGGALLRATPLLGRTFMVIYGDSYLDTSYSQPWAAFCRSGLPALMTVHRNEGRWDASNVEFAEGVVRLYDKVVRTPAMHYIDYGLGVFSREALLAITLGESFDLAHLYGTLAKQGLLAGYEVCERFYEIGSSVGLTETDRYLRARSQGL